jgi:hypothetical protein
MRRHQISRRNKVTAAVFSSLVAGALLASITAGAGAQQTPTYWVDGARPNPSATPNPNDPPAVQDVTGCVPYSADRADWHICGDVADDFSPPPKPYYDEEICSATLDWMNGMRGTLEAAGTSDELIAESWPPVDPSSCKVQEGPKSLSAGDGLVLFARTDVSGRWVHVSVRHGLGGG